MEQRAPAGRSYDFIMPARVPSLSRRLSIGQARSVDEPTKRPTLKVFFFSSPTCLGVLSKQARSLPCACARSPPTLACRTPSPSPGHTMHAIARRCLSLSEASPPAGDVSRMKSGDSNSRNNSRKRCSRHTGRTAPISLTCTNLARSDSASSKPTPALGLCKTA